MNGFDSLQTEARRESTPAVNFDMTRLDIQRGVARAYRLRADQIHRWGHKMAQTWASVFRRRGHLLPTHTRSRARWVAATKL